MLYSKNERFIRLMLFIIVMSFSQKSVAQLSYAALPDTIYQEYERDVYTDRIICDDINQFRIIPIKWKIRDTSIITKKLYRKCENCLYEPYLDSVEVRPAYHKIKLNIKPIHKEIKGRRLAEEWAWVKIHDSVPANHQPCLNNQGIDTCLWAYKIIQQAIYTSIHRESYSLTVDTIFVPALYTPIVKYELSNKAEIKHILVPADENETILLRISKILEPESWRNGGHPGCAARILPHAVSYLTKSITPLNYRE